MEIANAIERLYLEWKDGNSAWHPDWKVIHQYQRRKITRRLAEEFNRLVTAGDSK